MGSYGPLNPMRDAIVYSGSGWEGTNVLERLAIALSKLGAKVLYCDNPVSRLKGKPPGLHEVEPNIFRLRPGMFGHRLNKIQSLAEAQSRIVARQIAAAAEKLQLRKPMFFYSYTGRLLPVCAEMKRLGYFLVHVCMDFPEAELRAHMAPADLTFVIPSAALTATQSITGARVIRIPQLGPPERNGDVGIPDCNNPESLQNVPHPRLIYAGALQNRVYLPAVHKILQENPGWNFVHFGSPRSLQLPNAHALPWMSAADLARVIASCDVGFMPYNCSDPVQYNCVPLKLLDYFGMGMPVVTTPIVSMLEMRDVVYLGETAGELIDAIQEALRETADSPRRARRKEIAREHSLVNIASLLRGILPLEG